jgi:hypothetical protein
MYFSAETIQNAETFAKFSKIYTNITRYQWCFLSKKRKKHEKKLFEKKRDFLGNFWKKNTKSGIFGSGNLEEKNIFVQSYKFIEFIDIL